MCVCVYVCMCVCVCVCVYRAEHEGGLGVVHLHPQLGFEHLQWCHNGVSMVLEWC
jgi:hypothetical protein